MHLHRLKQFAIYESRIDGISGITTFFYKPTENDAGFGSRGEDVFLDELSI